MPFLILLIIIAAVVYYWYSNRQKQNSTENQPKHTEEAPKTTESMIVPDSTDAPKPQDDEPVSAEKPATPPENIAPIGDTAEQPSIKITAFPYPAKTPSECRFPGNTDNTNFQEYGEVPVDMTEGDFIEWWFFCEDLDKPCWSYVGMDKQNRCILQRRYRHGIPDKYTFEKRFFLIKRNIMASAFALAMMNDSMERTDYFCLIDKLNHLVPPTGDPEKDGPEILLPPQELLDNPSREERERAEQEREQNELSGKVVYKDNKRKLYFAEDGHTPMLEYENKTYSLSCHPYEPMLIIRNSGADVAYIHNAFYPNDEYKVLLKGQLVSTITGHYHNAERFARLITTAIDTGCSDFGKVENMMYEGLVLDKGEDAIEYAAYDFKCDRVLYEGVPLLLGHFNCIGSLVEKETGRKNFKLPILKVYALGFGYPNPHGDMYEYYYLSGKEYEQYMQWQERREWSSHEAAYEWHDLHLHGKQVLCNEFSTHPKNYKQFFRISELPHEYNSKTTSTGERTLQIKYSRSSVCAQDDYVNHDITIKLPEDAVLGDLVLYLQTYRDDSYSAIPYTGGNAWWNIKANGDVLAVVCDDHEHVTYNRDPRTLLSTLGITSISGERDR